MDPLQEPLTSLDTLNLSCKHILKFRDWISWRRLQWLLLLHRLSIDCSLTCLCIPLYLHLRFPVPEATLTWHKTSWTVCRQKKVATFPSSSNSWGKGQRRYNSLKFCNSVIIMSIHPLGILTRAPQHFRYWNCSAFCEILIEYTFERFFMKLHLDLQLSFLYSKIACNWAKGSVKFSKFPLLSKQHWPTQIYFTSLQA